MNCQPIEKKSYHPKELLDVVAIFTTIQGEGPYTGHRAIFIRLAGCNLQCPGCDTDYTTDRTLMSVADIIKVIDVNHPNPKLVVITGGEPFRQNISPLARQLILFGYKVQVETNGTLPPPPMFPKSVTVICSPKTGKLNAELEEYVTAYKYVLHHEQVAEDGLPIKALDHSVAKQVARPRYSDFLPVYLQPMDCKDESINFKNQEAVVKSCLEHGHILQLQIHKLLDLE